MTANRATLRGTTLSLRSDAVRTPATLTAVTVNVAATPFGSFGTRTDVAAASARTVLPLGAALTMYSLVMAPPAPPG